MAHFRSTPFIVSSGIQKSLNVSCLALLAHAAEHLKKFQVPATGVRFQLIPQVLCCHSKSRCLGMLQVWEVVLIFYINWKWVLSNTVCPSQPFLSSSLMKYISSSRKLIPLEFHSSSTWQHPSILSDQTTPVPLAPEMWPWDMAFELSWPHTRIIAAWTDDYNLSHKYLLRRGRGI